MSDQGVHVVVLTGVECSDCEVVAWLSKVLEAERAGTRPIDLSGGLSRGSLRGQLSVVASGNAYTEIGEVLAHVGKLQRRLDALTAAAKAVYDDNGSYCENRDRLGAILYPTGE